MQTGTPGAARHGLRVTLADDGLEVTVDATAGPRITSLTALDGDELMAVLEPPLTVGPADGARTDLHGGHRLWVAPEVPEITYACDDGPGRVESTSATSAAASDAGTPVARRLDVAVTRGRIDVAHTVTNTGEDVMRLAPWALTQLRPGGTVCLPVGRAAADPHGLQASGSVVTWPYTRLDDPRIAFEASAVTIDGTGTTADDDPVKLGVDGSIPWLAYATGDTVVVVHTDPRPQGILADLGATLQSYVGHRFVELEALGGLRDVAPGESLTLRETWTVHRRTWELGEAIAPHVERLVESGGHLATSRAHT